MFALIITALMGAAVALIVHGTRKRRLPRLAAGGALMMLDTAVIAILSL